MEVFGIGLPELLLIMVLILIVVGPQRLPEMAAQLGRLVRDFRRYTSELSRDITDALQDIEKEYTQVKEEWKEVGEAVRREGEAIKAEVSGAAKDADAALKAEPETPPAETAPAQPEGKVVSMEEAAGRRAGRTGVSEATESAQQDRPAGQGGPSARG